MKNRRFRSRLIHHSSAPYCLRIGKSPIEGLGVFALEDIPAGRRVIEFTGKHLSQSEASKLGQEESDYIIAGNFGRLIDGRKGGSGAEFVNHSCEPNLTWQSQKGRVFFVSRRRIAAGEELTILYGYPIKARRMPCCCGERKCCKTLRYILK